VILYRSVLTRESVIFAAPKAREWNPDNPLDLALMKMEFDIAMSNLVSALGSHRIHVDHVIKCTRYFITKTFDPKQMDNIMSGFSWALGKYAFFVLDLDPTHENTKPAIDWVNVMKGQGKSMQDIIKMFAEAPGVGDARNRVPDNVKLTAIAGQHSTMAAQVLRKRYLAENNMPKVEEVSTREAVVFVAGWADRGGVTDDELMTVGSYDNINTKIMEYKNTPAGLLGFFISHAEGLNLRNPDDKTMCGLLLLSVLCSLRY
jgi:hypothetical protein